jgi:hypothetical protein
MQSLINEKIQREHLLDFMAETASSALNAILGCLPSIGNAGS